MDIKPELHDIRIYAESFNQKLLLEFGSEKVKDVVNGGNLLLGTHYADSDKIFMTFNPGLGKVNNHEFKTGFAECNRYWDEPIDDLDYIFWKNSRKFFDSCEPLKNWICNTTSAFLIPWRTKNIGSLNKNLELKDRIFYYSGQITRRMIDHHQAKILVVSGVSTLRVLASKNFLDFVLDMSVDKKQSVCLGSNYQCKKVIPNRGYKKDLIIFQIPHFSRANSNTLLPKCAEWLWNQILRANA